MPYCPKCYEEFQKGMTVCPDCNVDLIEEIPPLPAIQQKDSEPLVCVAMAPNETIAYMWSEILEENGIHCLVKGDDRYPSLYVNYILRCYIYVLASERERAKEILIPFLEE
jgi:hypothetical protein